MTNLGKITYTEATNANVMGISKMETRDTSNIEKGMQMFIEQQTKNAVYIKRNPERQ
jgi:hypothetical protein